MSFFKRIAEPDITTPPEENHVDPAEPTTTPPATTAPDPAPPATSSATPPVTDPDVATLLAENAHLRLVIDVREIGRSRLADPDDLLRFVDDPASLVDQDGRPDHARISAAVDQLLTTRSYLASTSRPSPGSADGGARFGTDVRPVTREELAGMDPRAVDSLRRAGRLAHLGMAGGS